MVVVYLNKIYVKDVTKLYIMYIPVRFYRTVHCFSDIRILMVVRKHSATNFNTIFPVRTYVARLASGGMVRSKEVPSEELTGRPRVTGCSQRKRQKASR